MSATSTVMDPRLRRRLAMLCAIIVIVVGFIGLWLEFFPAQRYRDALPIFRPSGRPTVTLRQGTYVGVLYNRSPKSIEEFRGIPFAQSTAGEGRFGPPVPIGPSSKTFDAANHGYRCWAGGPSEDQNEDCLNANIMRPRRRPSGSKLPVLVHIYGGSFNSGSGPSRNLVDLIGYSPDPFIGVTFNYRVGALGFLPSGIMAKEGLLNAGLKDQYLFLQWLRDNIEAFGGDPNNVTLMGNSAGAHGIGHQLMLNTETSTLFHKAIIESGGATARACYTPDHPLHEQQFREFLALLDCASVPEAQLVDKLRGLSARSVADASQQIFWKYNPSVRWPFQPVIDGDGGMVPQRPIDSVRSKSWKRIPILTGFNTNEGAMFVSKEYSTNKQFTNFFETLLPGLDEEDIKILQEVYPDPVSDATSKFVETRIGAGVGPQYNRTEQAYGQFAYIAPVKQVIQYAADGGSSAYLYHFAVNSSVKGGSDHGNHMGYPTYNKEIRDSSRTLNDISGSMHAYWTSFITTGDPNKVKGRFPNRPYWPIYSTGDPKMAVFGEGNDERAGGGNEGVAVMIQDDHYMEKECQYWWARTEKFEV